MSKTPPASTAAKPVIHITPGDPVPAIALPDRFGERVDLSDQLIAGNTIVLWMQGTLSDKARQETARKNAAILADAETRLFILTGGVECPDAKPGKDSDNTTRISELFDPEARVASAFGVDGNGFVVIGADGRLSAVLPDDGFDGVIAHCRELFAASAPAVVRSQAPVLVLDRVLEPELCERLISYWNNGEKQADGVSTGKQSNRNANAVFKKRNDVVLLDQDLFNAVKDRLVRRVMPELFKVFQFRCASLEALRIGCYDSRDKGFFARHRDNRTEFTAHRRFAVSLNLNDAEYEGGQVRFPEFGRALYTSPPGGAVIFSCSLLHEVMPVTAGKRFAVFTFLTDAAGAKQEQEMLARRKQQVAPLAMQKH